jgi:hypothetical protein
MQTGTHATAGVPIYCNGEHVREFLNGQCALAPPCYCLNVDLAIPPLHLTCLSHHGRSACMSSRVPNFKLGMFLSGVNSFGLWTLEADH